MSTTIDTNIVQMIFDNKQFEQNCRQSMSTLEKLREKIDNSTSGKALDGLNKIDFSHVEKSVDSIANRFTFLGNMAFKIKDRISDAFLGMAKTLATTVPNIIKQGGWDRAMNIERAKFQLEGLHVAWQAIKGDIEYAVDGTAYGLDSAAKAASQLVASGVQVGDAMKGALRAISGVAAMTNSEYDAIAPIFTTVAGQSKLMTMQLRQLENRGLNAAATLADYFKGVMNGSVEASDSVKAHVAEITAQFGYGEAAVRDMVTKGVIDFNTFAQAMDSAFGEHAKDANRTFEGVTANIRAALKKIGADFATPVLQQDGPVVKALQQLRLRINDIRASLGPLTTTWTNFVNIYGKSAEVFLRKLDMSFMKDVVNGLVNSFQALLNIIRPIGYAFKDVFGSDAANGIQSIATNFEKLTAKLILSRDEMESLRATVRGVLSIGSTILTIIKQILGSIMRVSPESVNLRAIILNITGTLGNLLFILSELVKKYNIVDIILSNVNVPFKILAGTIVYIIIKIAEFIDYVRSLEIVSKVFTVMSTGAKVLATTIVALAAAIRNLVVNTIAKIPEVLRAIKAELSFLVDLLKQIPIVNSAIDGLNKLTDAFDKFLHPNKSDNAEMRETIQIVDEAVALAGPKKITMLERLINTLVTVKDKVVDVSSGVIEFIKNIDYGAIAAVTFTLAIAAVGYKLSKTFQSVADTFESTAMAVRQVGGFIGSFRDRSIMEFIFGKNEPPQQHKLLEFAVAIGAIAASFKLMSTIDVNKLKAVGLTFAGIGTGIIVIIGALTAAQKFLGSGEALVMTNALFAIAGSIALLTAALAVATRIDYTNIQKAGAAILQLSVVFGGLAIAIGVLAPELSASALSMIGLAFSIKMLIGALETLNNLAIEASLFTKEGRALWAKGGLLMTMAGGLVVISGIAARLGTNSLLGIVVALLSLKTIVPLANSVANSMQNSIFAKAWHGLVDFFKEIKSTYPDLMAGIVAFVAIGAAIVAIIAVIKTIKAVISAIGDLAAGMNNTNEKFAGLQKALARISLVPVIVALTGMMVTIGVLVGVLGKIKLPYINQAMNVLAAIGMMFLSLAVVVAASKDSKPGAIIGAMVGITMMFSELIVLTLLIEKHWASMITACGVMATIMGSLALVFDRIAKASNINNKVLVAIGMIAAIIAEMGGILYALSLRPWEQMLASGAAMSATMLAFTRMVTEIGKTGQSFTKNKFLAIAECAIVVGIIGATLALTSLTHDWKAIAAAGLSMSAVMITFGEMMNIVGKIQWRVDAWQAVAAIAVLAVSIGASLAIATLTHDWSAMLGAAAAMSIVVASFGAMAAYLGRAANMVTSFAMMATVAGSAVAIAASLSLLVNYPWQQILAVAGIMTALATAFGVLTYALGYIASSGVGLLGAGVLAVVSASMLGLSVAASMLLAVLTDFLPVADKFIGGVLGTLVTYVDTLPDVSNGLTQLSLGLDALAVSGVLLLTGAPGLILAGTALALIVPTLTSLGNIDIFKIASDLNAFVIPALKLVPVGLGLLAAYPGFVLTAGALESFGTALEKVAKVLNNGLINQFESLPGKMVQVGIWIPKSIAQGIAQEAKNTITVARNLAAKIEETIRNKLQIHSLSPLFKVIGGWISKSIGKGISDQAKEAVGSTDNMGQAIIDTINKYGKDFGISGTDLGNMFSNGLEGALNTAEQMTGIKLNGITSKMKSMANMLNIDTDFSFMSDASLPTDVRRQMQESKIKEITNAVNEATTATTAFDDAVSKAGGSSKKASEDVKDLSDAFKTVERGTKVSLNTMINNMADNYRETVLWANDMKTLMGKGFDKSITDAIQKMGVGGRETVKAYLTASEEQIPAINALAKRMLTLDEDAKKYIEGDYEKFATDIGNVLSEGITAWNSQLEKVVQDSLDPFGEFDAKTEMTSNKLLANMNSQLKGIRTWGDNLNILVEKGVNEGIIAHLIELGPKSYEQVNAMVNMTESQLAEMNDIWEQQSTIGQEIAMKFAEKMREIGASVSEGFTDGIDYTAVSDAGTDIGTEVTESAKKKLEINSPSHVFQRIGSGVIEGLELGIKVRQHIPVNLLVILATECINKTKDVLSFSAGMDIGSNFIDGLQKGIEDGESRIIASIENQAKAVIAAAYAAYAINSPSKEFRKVGLQIDEGLAQGIDWGTGSALSSINNLADSTITMFNQIVSDISQHVNDNLNLQPVIRPELDLSALQNSKSRLGSMFGNPGYEMAMQISASQQQAGINNTEQIAPATTNNQTIIFNQTNNSPKNIDPYESYRLNRLAMMEMKGALT